MTASAPCGRAASSALRLVEASAAITKGAYLKPAADGSGKAAVGAIGDHCAVAMGAATAAGQLIEAQIVKHVHA